MNYYTTKKYARTLEEAFGPYAGRNLHTRQEPMHPHDKVVVTGCIIGMLTVLLLALFDVLK